MPFRPLPDHELQRLDDDALIAYLRDASRAGDKGAARRALEILVYGHWRRVSARVALRVPAHAVEDVAADVIAKAIASSFDGTTPTAFGAWLNTILQRSVADFYRARERHVAEEPLGDEYGASHRSMGVGDETGFIEVQMLVETALRELTPEHRRVVELLVFEDRPAADAVAQVDGMSVANAYQIVRRFRTRLRALLEGRENA